MKTLLSILLLTLTISSVPISPVSAAEEFYSPDSKIDAGVFRDKGLITPKSQTLVEKSQILVKKWGCRISPVAGTGENGYSGDGGPATDAKFTTVKGITVFDHWGNLYIADGFRIRKVAANGIINTIAGSDVNEDPFIAQPDGIQGPKAKLIYPHGVAVDGNGNLYIAVRETNRIRRVHLPLNKIYVFVGSDIANQLYATPGFWGDDGPAKEAGLYGPEDVAVDAAGNLYIADTGNHRIRKVENGIISTVAGNGNKGFSGDLGQAKAAQLNSPGGVAVGPGGELYISDTGNNRIRKVYTNGIINTVAGTGVSGFLGDGGPPMAAQLNSPGGLAVGFSRELYIADTQNDRVRVLSPDVSEIGTFAGTGMYVPGGGAMGSQL